MGEFKIIFFLCLYSSSLLVLSSSLPHMCHPDDSLSLLLFKKEMFSLNDSYISSDCGQYSYPKMMMWNNTSSDCCKWDGITCNKITGHVIGLDLSCSMLKGVIHQNSTLFRLSHLIYLNLSFNDFSGSKISPNIGALSSLTHLNFKITSFKGTIPSELSFLSKLVLLDLSYNFQNLRFNPGDFQIVLQNLTHIRVLSLSGVQIPTALQANWSSSSLTYLDLGYTGVDGKFSNSIFHLPLLQTLILGENKNLRIGLQKSNCIFDGIPDFVCSFASLKYLDLSYCGLSGSSTNYIGNLSQIVELNLEGNSFTGQFPSYIGNLTRLTTLDLSYNFLRGPLPSNLSGFQKLRHLDLTHNDFDGSISSWIFSLPSLTFLSLNENHFTGQILEFLSPTSLQEVHLRDNQLNGPIPDSVFQLGNLSYLDLQSNNLSGSIEFTLFSNLKHLKILSLSHNKLTLNIENKINISFPNLSQLELSSCGITKFPDFLKNSSNLSFLDLSNNKLNGQIPNWINGDSLLDLDLSNNKLNGQIPNWRNGHSLQRLNLSHNSLSSLGPLNNNLTLMKNLELLDLGSNKFQETLPISICSLEQIFILDLSHNSFSGSIPKCFGNLTTSLQVMNLARNDLKGAISMEFPEYCQLLNINLNGNSLEGPLPRSLANCKSLEVLDIGNNKINDTFPTFLEDLVELQVLIIKSNRFSGSISNFKNENFLPNLLIFDLSCNEFSGALPPKLFKSFKAMRTLGKIEPNASYMEIDTRTGSPYTWSMTFVMKGNVFELVKILKSFIVIDLSSNNFIGEIPETIGDLNLLIALNLSRNNFFGHIPPKFGRLHFLESLDLSWNQIDGEIPWQLTEITNLEIFNVSKNHLQGRIPQGKQFNTFLNDSYFGNSGLCGFPMTKNCEGIDQPLSPSQGLNQDDESSFWSAFTWKPVLIGYGFGFAVGCLVLVTRKPKWLAWNAEKICLYALLLLGKKEICKQFMKKSRRANRKHYRRNNN